MTVSELKQYLQLLPDDIEVCGKTARDKFSVQKITEQDGKIYLCDLDYEQSKDDACGETMFTIIKMKKQ